MKKHIKENFVWVILAVQCNNFGSTIMYARQHCIGKSCMRSFYTNIDSGQSSRMIDSVVVIIQLGSVLSSDLSVALLLINR